MKSSSKFKYSHERNVVENCIQSSMCYETRPCIYFLITGIISMKHVYRYGLWAELSCKPFKTIKRDHCMMTSSNRHIFRVTGPLCGEFIVEFPSQRSVTWSFDVSLICALNKRLSKHSWGWWFKTPSRPLWRHYNDVSWKSNNSWHKSHSLHIIPISVTNVSRQPSSWLYKLRCVKHTGTCYPGQGWFVRNLVRLTNPAEASVACPGILHRA